MKKRKKVVLDPFTFSVPETTEEFYLVAIIPDEKYNSFPESSRNKIENGNIDFLELKNVEIKNPNNPVAMIPCKIITLRVPN